MKFSKSILVQLFFLVIFFSSCIVHRNNNVQKKRSDEVVQVTQKELPQILKKIPMGYEENYGFHNRDELQNALVGKPFSCYSLSENELKSTSAFRVPITVDQEFRALATVEYIKDTLHVVDFGANVLAKEIQAVCNENSNMVLQGILRIYSINSDFLVMTEGQQDIFIPLTSAKMYLKNNNFSSTEKYYTKDQIINLIGR